MNKSNYNSWNPKMDNKMLELVDRLDVVKKNNTYGEPGLSLRQDDRGKIQMVADMLNIQFNTTLSFSSVANRYHFVASSEQQKLNIQKRRESSRGNRAKRQEAVVEVVELPEPTTSNTGIADVIIKCSRLVKENKMTPEELCMLIDEL